MKHLARNQLITGRGTARLSESLKLASFVLTTMTPANQNGRNLRIGGGAVMTKRTFCGAGFALALFLIFGIRNASADAVAYTIGTPNSGIAGFPGPYATVVVTLTDSTHATITFTSASLGGNTYLMGDDGTAAVTVKHQSLPHP